MIGLGFVLAGLAVDFAAGPAADLVGLVVGLADLEFLVEHSVVAHLDSARLDWPYAIAVASVEQGVVAAAVGRLVEFEGLWEHLGCSVVSSPVAWPTAVAFVGFEQLGVAAGDEVAFADTVDVGAIANPADAFLCCSAVMPAVAAG